MERKKITLPLTRELARTLHAGDQVLLTGTIYTSRDAGHKRMCEALAKGEKIPFDPTVPDKTIILSYGTEYFCLRTGLHNIHCTSYHEICGFLPLTQVHRHGSLWQVQDSSVFLCLS